MPSHTIFVSNISYTASKVLLYELFIQAGKIKLLHYSNKYAFVEYYTFQDMQRAVDMFDAISLYNRKLSVAIVETKSALSIETQLEIGVVRALFSKYGSCKIVELKASQNNQSENAQGNRYECIFRRKDEADRAFLENNLKSFEGQKITIYKSKE